MAVGRVRLKISPGAHRIGHATYAKSVILVKALLASALGRLRGTFSRRCPIRWASAARALPDRRIPKPWQAQCATFPQIAWARHRVLIGLEAACRAALAASLNRDVRGVFLAQGKLPTRRAQQSSTRWKAAARHVQICGRLVGRVGGETFGTLVDCTSCLTAVRLRDICGGLLVENWRVASVTGEAGTGGLTACFLVHHS